MSSSREDSFTLQALQFIDAFLVFIAFFFGGVFRELILVLFGQNSFDLAYAFSISWAVYIATPFTPLILEKFGFYERLHSKSAQSAAWQLIQGLFFVGILISLFALFTQLQDTRRLLLVSSGAVMFLLLFARDRIAKSWISSHRSNHNYRERIIAVGTSAELEQFFSEIGVDAASNWNVVEKFDLSVRPSSELLALLKKESVSRVVFVTKSASFEKVAEAIELCELQGVEAWVAASFIRSQIARPVFDSVGSKPMLVLRSTPELSWSLLAKEIIDRVGAFFIILFTLPLWVIAAIGIRIKSPGAPVFYIQMRAGRYGKPFRMFKFRTMVANADALLEQIKKEHGNQMDGPVFKLDHDPRIFPFGAILRKLSIDELPQLLNVLKGDISLVGPRPLPLYEVEAFSEISHRRRLSVKPGITCEWQAGGRNQITKFEDWVEMDLRYIDRWSLWLDFKILLKTIPAVLFAKGAK